ncbi:MAG: ribosome maturation factor RimP [Actinobacteria bacterium]|nr:ribosome maturation factor RimP [Actinomycetota bacterium]
MAAATTDELMTLLSPIVAGADADLEAVLIRKAGSRSVVVVTVDRDGGVELDAIAHLSRRISEALDESEVMGQTAYVLEVGSPGVDRPLTQPQHWRRAKLGNRLVKVTTNDGQQVTGRILSTDGSSVTLDSLGEDPRELPFEQISKAVVEVEFNSPKGDV